jgi:putative transcription factor
MECEMCGRRGQLMRAEIEGSVLSVCSDCASFGKRVDVRSEVRSRRPLTIENKSINPDYAKIIRSARVSAVLSIEQLSEKIGEKANVVERVEKGMRPTDALAKKLEKALNVRLFGFAEQDVQIQRRKDTSQSLGDIAVIRHKKK